MNIFSPPPHPNDEEQIPWFTDFANYLVGKILIKGLTYAQRCKFFSELKHYLWDEPYLFKMCSVRMIMRCVYDFKTRKILDECHHGPTGGHYGSSTTAKIVFDVGFYWPTIFKEAHTLVQNGDACQRSAEALPTNDARVVINFLKKLSSRFSIPKALISDRAYDPQTNGQVENTNRALKRILEKMVKDNPFVWSRKLDDALSAFHTAYKTPTGITSLQAYENSKLYKARTKAYHDKKLRIRKEFKAGDKVLLFTSKYKFKALKLISKWYGPFVVKHGFPSIYVKLYDKHGGSFIVNGHRVKLYHDQEQLNELSSEEIHFLCKEVKMKAIPFMTPFPHDYRKTMPWVTEKPFIYTVVENTCNEAKLYDLDETGKVIVEGNILYIKEDPSEELPLNEK
ncbi:reverse transcriptase domain-containing protein [Tanacetum coccineum]